MPRDGYENVTLPKETLKRIDKFVDGNSKEMKSRPRVISKALKEFERCADGLQVQSREGKHREDD